MSHTTPIDLSDINFDDDLLMDYDFTTVIPETQIENISPSNSQKDLSPEEAGKRRLHALLELKNPVLRLEPPPPLLIKLVELWMSGNPISEAMLTILQVLRGNITIQWLDVPSYPPAIKDRIRSIVQEINTKRRSQGILEKLTVTHY